jgi:GTP cyclohydrolase II
MQNSFVETKVTTQFGRFNFRVYKNLFNNESIVLYTETLDPTVPVLVRIHSECITGETFRSLQCDCGPQLSKSLKLINKSKNGILVYLRQEGRGIGLFEKIKSYQLQQKGHDTFDANLMLGHQPDPRTYGMVKTILDDLGVTRINLLTNNPSKISETAKLGIEVVERIPLIILANVYNKNYLLSKKTKFKHLLSNKISNYFYQFHVDSADQVEEISKFLKDIKLDPFLKIYVGIVADHTSLLDEKEMVRIMLIFGACHSKGLTPVLHYSFRDSMNSIKDIHLIKKRMPFVEHLQLNDLPNPQDHAIKLACRLFYAYIPLSNENFDLVNDENFRKLIKKHHAFILLDNSKGKGIHDSKESFMGKIDLLLNYGLNDIALYGGFGPNSLDTYFELRRYYKINFSIGAQTNLQTDGQIDIEKVKLYLSQLI